MRYAANLRPYLSTLIIYNVICKSKRKVLFNARCLQLCANLVGKDVVSYDVLLTVMLVESAALAVIDQIVLYTYSA